MGRVEHGLAGANEIAAALTGEGVVNDGQPDLAIDAVISRLAPAGHRGISLPCAARI